MTAKHTQAPDWVFGSATEESEKKAEFQTMKQEIVDEKIKVPKKEENAVEVLCIPLYRYKHSTQFVVCTTGVLVCFILYGYCQELMFQLPGFRPLGMFLTLIQFVMYTIFAFSERHFKGDLNRRIPIKSHCLIAFLSVSTMGLSNCSVGYLNYPTHVMFKCCTLIPVLLGGVIIQGKKHDIFDFLAAIFMSVGLVFFMLTDSAISPNFNTTGVTLILLALLADAAIGNVQEKAMKTHSATVLEVVFYSNMIGTVYLCLMLAVMNQLKTAVIFCNQHILETYGYGALISICGYCGLQMMLVLVRISGAFTAAVVANCRKGMTVVISFVAFEKPFSIQYLWSGLVIFLGIFFNTLGKNPELKSWTLHKVIILRNFILSPFYVCRQYRPVTTEDPEA